MTQLILFDAFNGLIVGAFYALMALGLSLILNLTGVINFAHGGFLALGAYLAFTLIPYIGFWGALALAPILTALFGLADRARTDPASLWPGSALQLADDLRSCLHVRGWSPLHLGGADSSVLRAGLAHEPAQQHLLLPDGLSAVSWLCWSRWP